MIRGSGNGSEFRRVDESFYRGIVIQNNDPLSMNRVKIFIPELSNQPFDEWIDKYDIINIKFPGTNNTTDTWKDTKIFYELTKTIPWAEPCFPLFGESSNARYYADGGICTVSDCNYLSGFTTIDTTSLNLSSGSFAPAFLYENKGTTLGDAFSSPVQTLSVKCNPYSFNYRPSKNVNKAKGIMGIPEIGTKVWVFHENGDLNFPVYFGVTHDFRELTLINNTDNTSRVSPTYPSDFEN